MYIRIPTAENGTWNSEYVAWLLDRLSRKDFSKYLVRLPQNGSFFLMPAKVCVCVGGSPDLMATTMCCGSKFRRSITCCVKKVLYLTSFASGVHWYPRVCSIEWWRESERETFISFLTMQFCKPTVVSPDNLGCTPPPKKRLKSPKQPFLVLQQSDHFWLYGVDRGMFFSLSQHQNQGTSTQIEWELKLMKEKYFFTQGIIKPCHRTWWWHLA